MKNIFLVLVRGLLWILSPLSFLYQFLFFLDKSKSIAKTLDACFVISVGNITVGGTGKTPFVQYLIPKLKLRFPDFQFTILSRGYMAKLSAAGTIVSSNSMPGDVGDEPLLHKQLLPDVQVIIGRDRYSSFKMFNKVLHHKHIVILDDGFQHHKLNRNFDIVLLDATSPIGNGFTLPLGILREGISALNRANTIIFTKIIDQNSTRSKLLKEKLTLKFPLVPVFFSRFKISKTAVETNSNLEKFKANTKYHIITAVGNPNYVFDSAKELFGVSDITLKKFPDHYDYSESDLEVEINNLASDTSLVTTEKDWVKWHLLPNFMKTIKEKSIPIILMKLELVMENEDAFIELVVSRVSSYVKEIALP